MLGLAATMAGMAYVIYTEETDILNNTSLLLAVVGIVLVAFIAVTIISQTRKQLIEQASAERT